MDLDTVTRRFPLILRSRPPCRDLGTRVLELHETSVEANAADPPKALILAAEVCNKAALVASDCGMAVPARELCWRQYDVFDEARPLSAEAAKLALQPILNIPRQLIREEDGDRAYRMLEQLYRAAKDRTGVQIDGRQISLQDVTRAADDHKTICTLLWAALLADGTRALTLAGRWHDAAHLAAAHRGVGTRLLDGRQITILSLVHQGAYDDAVKTVDESVTPEPWERAVASLLHVYCRRAARRGHEGETETMLIRAREILDDAEASTAVVRSRIGITAIDLAEGNATPRLREVRAALMATARTDAYAAQDVLLHERSNSGPGPAADEASLAALVEAAGLRRGTMPGGLFDMMMDAVDQAENRLRDVLGRHESSVRHH